MAAPISRYVNVQTINEMVRTFCFFILIGISLVLEARNVALAQHYSLASYSANMSFSRSVLFLFFVVIKQENFQSRAVLVSTNDPPILSVLKAVTSLVLESQNIHINVEDKYKPSQTHNILIFSPFPPLISFFPIFVLSN